MAPVHSKVKKKHFRCSLPSCSYYAPKGFYGFPKNEKLRKKWQDLCGMKEVKKCYRLCFQHFEESQIMAKNSDEQPRLKLGGVPSLNLPKVRNKTRIYRKNIEGSKLFNSPILVCFCIIDIRHMRAKF